MISLARKLELFFAARYQREALYLPSGRFALFLALQAWLTAGARVLMSPVNDDVVLFTVLAAGMQPVFGPVDPATGNLDPERMDESLWAGIDAVLTTNLYGIPDRMDVLAARCAERGILLLEDACQALDTRYCGRRIGQFSPVAVFSLGHKHVAGAGGMLCFSEASRRPDLKARAESLLRRPAFLSPVAASMRSALKWLAEAVRLRDPHSYRVHRGNDTRTGHRMDFDPDAVMRALHQGGGLDAFDPWVRVDNVRFRTWPDPVALRRTWTLLANFKTNRRRRMAGTERLLGLGLTPADIALPSDTALFRVPLFVKRREDVLAYFRERGLWLDYIYDPPLDRIVPPPIAQCMPSVPEALRWSRDVLPVDPLKAEAFLALAAQVPGLLEGATAG